MICRSQNEIIKLMFDTFTERVIKRLRLVAGDELYCRINANANATKLWIQFYVMWQGKPYGLLTYSYGLYIYEQEAFKGFCKTYKTTIKRYMKYEDYNEVIE